MREENLGPLLSFSVEGGGGMMQLIRTDKSLLKTD